MNLRWFLLLLVLASAALGSLTVFRARPGVPWQLAVIAGEYGHWLAIGPVVVVVSAWLGRGQFLVLPAATIALGCLALGLFLRPAFQAWRIASNLPERLLQAFGPVPSSRPAFRFSELWMGRAPKPVEIETLQYAEGLELDFYRPERPAGGPAASCVVVVHGGGWDGGERTQLPDFNHWLARRGYAVAAISYRLAPAFRWPAQRDDVLAAIGWLQRNAASLGIDPTRLVLFGRSAGGQIVQAAGYTEARAEIRGVAAWYAPSDLVFGYVNTHEDDMLKSPALMRQFLGGTPESARANYESASALFHVDPATPPTLLVHGANDALVWHRHSERLDARLAEAGVPRLFVSLPWATHAMDYNLHGPGGQLSAFALEWFLTAVTR